MSDHGSFWFDFLCGLAFMYVVFHWTPIIAFLDRLLAS